MEGSSPLRASGSPGPDFMTPRTKLAKMLADIDNEVDNAPTPSPPKEPAANVPKDAFVLDDSHRRPSDRPFHPGNPSERAFGPSETQLPEEASDEDSDDAVRRPRGRTAKRMLGVGGVSVSETPSRTSSPPPKRTATPDADDSEDQLLGSVTPLRGSQYLRDNSPSAAGSTRGNGLFVSPTKSFQEGGESEEELPSNPFGSKEKLAELISQKRAERLAKEAEEKKRRKQQKEQSSLAHASSDLPDEAVEGPGDEPNLDIERIMSDASRPARKASKKALLEMERETQRLARQQALAHQMKVKKRFTTEDLFARFNMRPANATTGMRNDEQRHAADSSASSVPNSDGVEERLPNPVSTPPSSPPTPFDKQKALVDQGALSKLLPVRQDSIASLAHFNDDEELPDLAEILKASQQQEEAKATDAQKMPPPRQGLKIARFGKQASKLNVLDSDEDEIEVMPRLPPHLRVFERATGAAGSRTADSKAVHNLRHLAHLNHDDSKPRQRKGARPSISHSALEARLRKQAKDQARRQQLERIEELRAKGIDIQTSEEREREADALQDLLEKARLEAQALRRMERKQDKGGEAAMEASDDEDEDFEPDASDEEDVGKPDYVNELVDEAAEETDEDEELEGSEDESAEPEEAASDDDDASQRNDGGDDISKDHFTKVVPRRARFSRVIAEDDEEDEAKDDQSSWMRRTPKSTPGQADPFAAFGFGAAGGLNALLSPTQAFNATMQTPTQEDSQEDSFDILQRIAPRTGSPLPPTLPEIDTETPVESQDDHLFVGSQLPDSQRVNLNWETQAPETPVPAGLNRDPSALSETPTWEPSQDQGLPSPWTVAPKWRLGDNLDSVPEQDTQTTVAMRISESPKPSSSLPRKRGKLARRQAATVNSSDEDAEAVVASARSEKRDAFREMARKRKEALSTAERDEADKELRAMMEEQAEESEDEYAGLGGDDFVAPETDADREMIDSSAVDVDERALAAHYAERERERNEAETSRLYKDLTTGVLRRRMNANAFDLEEDEDELAVRRRRMRQQEEARKRKALLKDDNVKTLAEGRQSKGKDAFLKAIADDDGDEEVVGVSDNEEGTDCVDATQEESQQHQALTPDNAILQETSGNKRRMPGNEESAERPPAKMRRTAPSAGLRRPTSMLEVQESVSFLLDEPQAAAMAGPTILDVSDSEHSTDSDDDGGSDHNEEDLDAAEQARQNDGGFAPNPLSVEARARKDSIDMPPPPPRLPANQRRTAALASKVEVIDRLSLRRASSTSDSGAAGHGRAAWGAATSNTGFGFPSLLRRATTNSDANERGVTTNAAGKGLSREGSSSGVKQGGSKKSSLAYQARAEERKAIVEASARRREENTRRIAAMRRQGSAAGPGKAWGGAFE